MAKARPTATVADLVQAMEKIAPTWVAEEWDNVGLLEGSPDWPVRRLLLTIDLTPAVLNEARRGRFEAILAYHSPIFKPVKKMVPDRRDQAGLAAEALSHRIAVYSPHTALDSAPGGTNDTLAALCGLEDVRPMTLPARRPEQCKLVVFVPAENVDGVAEAVFEAGAGQIGDYEQCSFRLSGEGTFFGGESTSPVVGKKGRLERLPEIRLEAVFPRSRLAEVVAAVRRSHPYEEPAFDVYPLESVSAKGLGPGRVGRFAKPIALKDLARLLARKIAARSVTIVGDAAAKLRRGIVCVGAAGSLPFEVAPQSLCAGDVVITGEIRHHDALLYRRSGAAAIALGHWASERPVLAPLAARLRKALRGVACVVSREDRDPFQPG